MIRKWRNQKEIPTPKTQIPTIYVFDQKEKCIPCIPQFFYIKCGKRGLTLYGHVFLMVLIAREYFEIE